MPYKVVVVTGNLTYSVRKVIVEIDRAIRDLSWLIVLESPKRTVTKLARNQWRNLRRNGWRWIPYQVDGVVQRIRSRFGSPVASAPLGSEYRTSALRSRENIRILQVDNFHDEKTLNIVQEFAPDLGLSLAAPILKRSLFSIPRLGTLNLHKGALPMYRGMPPAFW